MRASLGLACAQATTLCTQVVGQTHFRRSVGHEWGAPVLKHHPPALGLCGSLRWMQPSLLLSVSLLCLLVRVALTLRSLRIHPPPLCGFAVF